MMNLRIVMSGHFEEKEILNLKNEIKKRIPFKNIILDEKNIKKFEWTSKILSKGITMLGVLTWEVVGYFKANEKILLLLKHDKIYAKVKEEMDRIFGKSEIRGRDGILATEGIPMIVFQHLLGEPITDFSSKGAWMLLSKNYTANRLTQVALHELGHTLAITECKDKNCLMSHPCPYVDNFCKKCDKHIKTT